jgi:hypothetical protein
VSFRRLLRLWRCGLLRSLYEELFADVRQFGRMLFG